MTETMKVRAKRVAKRESVPKGARQGKKGMKLAAIGERALKIGRAVFSVAKFVAATGLLVVTAVGAAALMPKHLRKQVVSEAKHIAALTTSEVTAKARALGV